MQTRFLRLLIVFLLLCRSLTYAQNTQIIGTGTNNSNNAPINRYYKYSIAEMLYTAAEINNTGYLNKLAFQKASGGTTVTIENVSIYLKTTSATVLNTGTTDTTGYTLVWSGNFPNSLPSGWAEITLNNAFYYNGTDNLQVLVLKKFQAYASDYPKYNYTTTSSNQTRSYHSDTNPWTTSRSLSTTTKRPNIRLTLSSPVTDDAGITAHTPQLLCPGSTVVTATLQNFGTQALTSATINWAINGTPQTAISWTGNLASNQQTTVNLGNYTFSQGNNYTLTVSSANPNNTTDGNTSNDSYSSPINLAFTGTYTIGGTAPNYPDLGSAITDLANNGLCGAVILELRDGTYNGAVTIPAINGLSASNTLTIRPAATASNVVLTSNNATATLTLDGADYVTIDGRSGGTGINSALDIDNTNNDGSTVYLVNGATYNTMEYCHIRNYCWEYSKGIITFGQDGFSVPASAGGNSNNTIRFNHLRESSAGSTYQAIVSQASSSNPNRDNLVTKNSIYNYDTEGILLKEGSTNWRIHSNSFYHTTSQTGHIITIQIEEGTGYTISNNYMGGSDYQMGGNPTTTTGSGRFTGINIENGVGTGTVDIINNKIKNIKTAYHFSGIELSSGTVLIKGNEIGGVAANEKIESELREARGIEFYGSDVEVTIEGNKIGNIHFNGNSSLEESAYGIAAQVGKFVIRNNEIFNITSNGNHNNHSPEDNLAAGIYVERSAYSSGAIAPIEITGNEIHHIQQLVGNDIGLAAGIYVEDEKNNTATITRNKIYEINTTSTTHAGNVWGIYVALKGDALVANNQIKVGRTTTGIAQVEGLSIAGASGNDEIYYNTIVVDGMAGTSAATASFCLSRIAAASCTVLNNLFVNNRTGGTVDHYCVGNNNSSTSAWRSNYNLFCAHNANAINQWGGADKNFTAWNAAASSTSSWSEEVATINLNNLFDNFLAGHLDIDPNQNECWYVNGKGVQIAAITSDVNSITAGRSTIVLDGGTDIGANEFIPNVVPPLLTITGSHSLGGTEILSFANRPVAKIQWGNSGNLPTIQAARYYSGTNPNDATNNGAIASPRHFNAYWDIKATGGSNYTYTITLLYDEALLGSISSESLAQLAKKETGVQGSWQTYSSSVNSSSNELYHSGLNSFSEFTALLDANSILPITLLSFIGQRNVTNVDLQWITSSEVNNAFFVLQKSSDGTNWAALDTVAGQGTTTQQTVYNYTDTAPYGGYNYYRLLQVDFSGSISHISNVISVYFDLSIQKTKNSQQYFWVNQQGEICLVSEREDVYRVRVYTTLGQAIYEAKYNVNAGMNKLPLNTDALSPNVYIISIDNHKFRHSQKVILSSHP